VSPPPATARATSVRPARVGTPRTEARRPPLRVLEALPRRRGRLLRTLAVALIALSLLAVVVAHSVLAQGQVRLTTEQSQVAAEQALHRQLLATVAKAENPATIIAEAKNLNLVPPASVKQLPAVSLSTPIHPATASTNQTASRSTTGPSSTTGQSATR